MQSSQAESAYLLATIPSASMPKALFEEFNKRGLKWSELDAFAQSMSSKLASLRPDSLFKDPDEIVMALVEHRDVVDCALYQAAAKQIFGDGFAVDTQPNNFVKDGPDGPVTGFRFYQLEIRNQLRTGFSRPGSEVCARIIIKAPGSRTRTSDIDTTVSVRDVKSSVLSADLFDNSREPVANRANSGPIELAGNESLLIQAAMIEAFHLINQATYHMTSATHRDSNVYSDGFLGEPKEIDHPLSSKFYNPEIADQPLMDDPEYARCYQLHKKTKHQQELAASLFSLRQSMGDNHDEWIAFQHQLTDEDTLASFNIKDNVPLGTVPRGVASLIKADLQEVFSLVDQLYVSEKQLREQKRQQREAQQTRQEQQQPPQNQSLSSSTLSAQAQSSAMPSDTESNRDETKEREEDNHSLAGSNHHALEAQKDLNIRALNELYVESLRELANVAKQLHGQMKAIKQNLSLLTTKKIELDEVAAQRDTLGDMPASGDPAKRILAASVKEAAEANSIYLAAKKELMSQLQTRATLQNQYQEAQIKANLFAYEAYVNRSAPFHVVEGMQTEQFVSITRKTVMGSALQQIGFKLLHTQQQKAENINIPEAVIAYKTAKYGQRVAHLLLNDKNPFNPAPGQGKSKLPYKFLHQTGIVNGVLKIKVLDVLNKEIEPNRAREPFYTHFDPEEYELINLQSHLANIKSKDISESEKAQEAAGLLSQWKSGLPLFPGQTIEQKEQELWLSIAAKMVMATYKARLLGKGRLWGGEGGLHAIAQHTKAASTSSSVAAAASPDDETDQDLSSANALAVSSTPHQKSASSVPLSSSSATLFNSSASGAFVNLEKAKAQQGGLDVEAHHKGRSVVNAPGVVVDKDIKIRAGNLHHRP